MSSKRRYHISDDGQPRVCTASDPSRCPMAKNGPHDESGNLIDNGHFEDLTSATEYSEKILAPENSPTSLRKNSADDSRNAGLEYRDKIMDIDLSTVRKAEPPDIDDDDNEFFKEVLNNGEWMDYISGIDMALDYGNVIYSNFGEDADDASMSTYGVRLRDDVCIYRRSTNGTPADDVLLIEKNGEYTKIPISYVYALRKSLVDDLSTSLRDNATWRSYQSGESRRRKLGDVRTAEEKQAAEEYGRALRDEIAKRGIKDWEKRGYKYKPAAALMMVLGAESKSDVIKRGRCSIVGFMNDGSEITVQPNTFLESNRIRELKSNTMAAPVVPVDAPSVSERIGQLEARMKSLDAEEKKIDSYLEEYDRSGGDATYRVYANDVKTEYVNYLNAGGDPKKFLIRPSAAGVDARDGIRLVPVPEAYASVIENVDKAFERKREIGSLRGHISDEISDTRRYSGRDAEWYDLMGERYARAHQIAQERSRSGKERYGTVLAEEYKRMGFVRKPEETRIMGALMKKRTVGQTNATMSFMENLRVSNGLKYNDRSRDAEFLRDYGETAIRAADGDTAYSSMSSTFKNFAGQSILETRDPKLRLTGEHQVKYYMNVEPVKETQILPDRRGVQREHRVLVDYKPVVIKVDGREDVESAVAGSMSVVPYRASANMKSRQPNTPIGAFTDVTRLGGGRPGRFLETLSFSIDRKGSGKA